MVAADAAARNFFFYKIYIKIRFNKASRTLFRRAFFFFFTWQTAIDTHLIVGRRQGYI